MKFGCKSCYKTLTLYVLYLFSFVLNFLQEEKYGGRVTEETIVSKHPVLIKVSVEFQSECVEEDRSTYGIKVGIPKRKRQNVRA
jgi:hypothetical protein